MSKLEAHLYGYSTSGFELPQIVVRAETPEELATLLRGLATNGITATPPDPSEVTGEKSETITVIVKRIHIGKNNQETPVIDLYPNWQGDYGQYRFVGVYLNTPDQITEFEQHAGVRVADLPVYESQAPLQRNAARRNRCEIACTPFLARKAPDGEKEIDGKVQQTYKFGGFAPLATGGASAVTTSGSGNQSSASDFKAPPWWNAVLKVAIPKFYDGVQQHATNSVKKLMADGSLTPAMTAEQVLTFLRLRWEAGDDAPEPQATPEYDEIPF